MTATTLITQTDGIVNLDPPDDAAAVFVPLAAAAPVDEPPAEDPLPVVPEDPPGTVPEAPSVPLLAAPLVLSAAAASPVVSLTVTRTAVPV